MGVSLVNLLLVLLQNTAAVQLLRGGGEALCNMTSVGPTTPQKKVEHGYRSAYVLRVPLFISKNDAINDLKAGKAALATSILELLEDGVIDLRLVDELLEMLALQAKFSGKLLERRLGWDDNGDGLSLALVSIDADIGDNVHRAVDGLEL